MTFPLKLKDSPPPSFKVYLHLLRLPADSIDYISVLSINYKKCLIKYIYIDEIWVTSEACGSTAPRVSGVRGDPYCYCESFRARCVVSDGSDRGSSPESNSEVRSESSRGETEQFKDYPGSG